MPTRRKTTTTRKRTSATKPAAPRTTATRATPAAAPKPAPDIAAIAKKARAEFTGQPVTMLRIPWEEKGLAAYHGARWHKGLRTFVYVGDPLPAGLMPYASEPYSWDRWLEDQVNGRIKAVSPGQQRMTPRPHQQVAIDKIKHAAQQGMRGAIEADSTGLGKTLASLLGAAEVATIRGFTRAKPAKVLILCPKSVIPHWRNTIRAAGVTNLRVAILNYDQSLKLITQPEVATKAKTTRTKNTRTINNGAANVRWDIIITDESQKLKNDSQRSKAFDVISRADEPASSAPFVIYSSATIGQSPLEVRYMASLIAQLVGRKTLTGKTWGQYLESTGFHVAKTKTGYGWINAKTGATASEQKRVAAAQREDTEKIGALLFNPKAPSIRRAPEDIAGWPSIQRIEYPVALEPEQTGLYKSLWQTFREELRLRPKGSNPKSGVVAQLRFRQKASLLLIDSTVDHVADLVENGYQVAVSVQFIESIELLAAKLTRAGITCEEFSGRQTAHEREAARLRFQRGRAQVIFFTVTEGISLHAKEELPDGSYASATPRATVVHDIRYSSIESLQIEGRAHRDGQAANVYYMYGEGTVQKPILDVMFKRMVNMRRLSGEAVDEAGEIERVLINFA